MASGKLSVFATVREGYRLLARDWWALLRILWLPVAILIVLDFQIAAIWQDGIENPRYGGWGYDDVGMAILIQLDDAIAILFFGLVVALWQRVRLVGDHFLSIYGLMAAWRNIVSLTVLWCCLILITVGVTWLFISIIPPVTSEFVTETLVRKFGLIDHPRLYRILFDLILHGGPLFVALHVVGRLGLMLWARPTGGDGALDRAWNAGDGNGWRIAAAIFLAILPVTMLESALQPGTVGGLGTTHFHLWSDAANLLQLIAAAGAFAAAHQALLGGKAPAETVSADWTA